MKKTTVFFFGAALLVSGTALAGNPAAGKERSKECAACHGVDGGTPITPDTPKLAGQHADYIVKSLQGYKAGTRKNPIMGPMAAKLSQREMEDLAAFYSRQQGLVTAR